MEIIDYSLPNLEENRLRYTEIFRHSEIKTILVLAIDEWKY